MRTRASSSWWRQAQRNWAALALVLAMSGCGINPMPAPDPFSTEPVPLDGVSRGLGSDVVNLGSLPAGQVVRIDASGDGARAVFVLRQDEQVPEAGVIVGGGRPAAPFDYRIAADGVYAVFVQFNPTAAASTTHTGRIALSTGDPSYRPPREQFVQVVFATGFLSSPGLFDPESMTESDRQLLVSLEPTVKQSILTELHRIFDPTPVRILSEADPLPATLISRLTYRPERVVSEDQTTVDNALPPVDPSRLQCQVRVDFGEVLPHGVDEDAGNRVLDDEAVVYVGSFQGRGVDCQTATINSLNNIVFALSQSGAHEIGHLIGLLHVEQIDIMNRTATLAFLRELSLRRGQVQIDKLIGGQIVSEVATSIVQDPDLYFRSAFDITP